MIVLVAPQQPAIQALFLDVQTTKTMHIATLVVQGPKRPMHVTVGVRGGEIAVLAVNGQQANILAWTTPTHQGPLAALMEEVRARAVAIK